jgi:A/G-specific adenine glycosylase
VAAFFPGFVRRFSSWSRLSQASEEDLRAQILRIGLWRRRVPVISKLAAEMARRRGRFPRNREEIEGLPGVGQYIANAVLLFCHGQAQPLLDGNMVRLLERYFGPRKLADIRYDPYLQGLAKEVVSCDDPISMNWAILDFASDVCRIRPRCDSCPLATGCKFVSASRGEALRTERNRKVAEAKEEYRVKTKKPSD